MPLRPQFRCLGSPTLYGPDGTAVRFRVRKHLALLAFLAMEPRTHRRDRLAELLWPGVTSREGRHSLATALSVLRARLGHQAIEASRDLVRLVPGSVELDLDRLAEGDLLGSETIPVLAVAPLLEDFDVPDAPGWGQWKDAQVVNWQPRIRDALLTLTDRSRRTGDSRTMERLADSLLAIDPLSEEGIRSKMEARAFAGDRLSALRHFETWKARLEEEVGAQPGKLVEGMAIRLRHRGWERTSEPHIAPVHTEQWKDRPFIGRGTEYRVLYENWESTQQGAPKHVIVTGDSGVGKSTLAAKLATAAGLQGAVSAREQCHEVARDIPYAAIGALAVGLLDKPGANAIAPEWLGELGRAVSEVKRRFPQAPPPLEGDGETVRIRIADAFIELACAVAEEQPLILILDDLHLADDASIAVLHLLLRRLERQRVQVIFTGRPGEIAEGGSARRLLDRADHMPLVTVALQPFTPEGTGELLDSFVAASGAEPPTPAIRRALIQAAAGYPMVLELLTDDWRANGEQCLALTLGGMTEQPTAAGLGEMYRRILERITAGLDPVSRNVLNLATVLGSRLNDFALYTLADLTLAQTMAGLSRLAAARILRDAGEGLEFINELIRAQAYVVVPSSVRRVLHSKVADLLIERAEGGERMLGLEIAWHCIRARRKEEFSRYLISGADEALEQGAHVVAERALLTAIPNLGPGLKEQAQFRLALVLQDQGRWGESKAVFTALSSPAVTDPALAEDIRATVTIADAMIQSQQAIPDDSLLHRLTAVIKGDVSLRMKLRAAAAAASYGVRTYHRSAVDVVVPLVDGIDESALTPADRADLSLTKAQLVWPIRQFTECLRYIDRASYIIPELPSASPLAMRMKLGRGFTLAAQARYTEAVPHLEEAARVAFRIGNDSQAAAALGALAQCHTRLGRYDLALSAIGKFHKLQQADIAKMHLLFAAHLEALINAMLRRPDAAQLAINHGDVIALQHSGSWMAAAWQLWSADALWCIGDQRLAKQRAADGIQGIAVGMNNVGVAGAYCRWCAVLSPSGNNSDQAAQQFVRQVREIEWRDTLDQTEIALSAYSLYGATVLTEAEVCRSQQYLARDLPVATKIQLRLLGLPPLDSTEFGHLPDNVNQSQLSSPTCASSAKLQLPLPAST